MSISPSLADMQANGFPVGADPLVAVDLADTLITAVDPPQDLIEDDERAAAWWALEAPRLPSATTPTAVALRSLRTPVRDLLDALVDGRTPSAGSIADLNAAAASVPSSPRLFEGDGALEADRRWHLEFGGNPGLAMIATELIAFLTDPAKVARLRRCANPQCSMLFQAENKRRVWCTANLCGNRARVARHYERRQASAAPEPS
jgi:predicted RNA-binding Zn ribbon-like protein